MSTDTRNQANDLIDEILRLTREKFMFNLNFDQLSTAADFDPNESGVRELTDNLTAIDADACLEMMSELDIAAQTLAGEGQENLDSAEQRVADWEGNAANNFEDCLRTWQTAIRLQPPLLTALRILVEAQHAVATATERGLIDILEQTRDSLDALEDGDSGSDVSTMFRVVGIAAAFVGAIASGGTTTPVVVTHLATVEAVAEVGSMITETEVSIGGATAMDIWSSMRQALNELAEDAAAETETIVEKAKRVLMSLEGADAEDLVPRRPTIANAGGYSLSDFAPPSNVPVAPAG